jgi:hypothetical protein
MASPSPTYLNETGTRLGELALLALTCGVLIAKRAILDVDKAHRALVTISA